MRIKNSDVSTPFFFDTDATIISSFFMKIHKKLRVFYEFLYLLQYFSPIGLFFIRRFRTDAAAAAARAGGAGTGAATAKAPALFFIPHSPVNQKSAISQYQCHNDRCRHLICLLSLFPV